MSKPSMIDKATDARDWFSDHPGFDFVAATLIVGAHAAVVTWGKLGDFLIWLDSDRRADLYAQSAAVVATLGGLAAIGLAIYQSASGDRTRAIRVLYGRELRKNWRSLLVMAGVSAGVAFLAMSLDHDGDPLKARFLFEFAMALAIVRFGRLVWIFDRILNIADRDLVDAPRPEPAPLSSRWSSSTK
ncbi:hypothetical protein [Verrucosispora sp. NA02020]|uniref:hypothetical protein n=1 Tax=Verrucosispora sp. NA02020 TaxID=2742132 RepID=UPI003D7101B4